MADRFSLKNTVVAITGATGYLGKEMATAALEMGASVALMSTDLSRAEDLAAQLDSSQVLPLVCDIRDHDSIDKALAATVSKFGALDVLVNNAFFGTGTDFFDVTDEDWDIGLDGSIKAVHRTTLAALPYLKESKAGRLINIASMYGMVVPDPAVYPASMPVNPVTYGVGKAAIIHYTRYAAMKLAPFEITVNAISYGPFPNPEKVNDAEFTQALANKTLLGRIGSLEDVASAVLFLSLKQSAYITGQNVVVDGGWTVQ